MIIVQMVIAFFAALWIVFSQLWLFMNIYDGWTDDETLWTIMNIGTCLLFFWISIPVIFIALLARLTKEAMHDVG